MSQRRTRRPVTALASALLVAAVLPFAAAAAEGDPVVFRVATTQAVRPVEMNPFLTTSSAGYTIMADRYDLLVGFGEDLTPAPGLAESWETSEDGLTWTYRIREGATWHDGQPVSAEDVAFTLNYIIDSHRPDYEGPAAPDGNDADGDGSADFPLTLFDNYLDLDGGIENTRIESVEAPDDRTVVITTREPIITLAQMFIPMLPQHIWEQKTFEEANSRIPIEHAIGSGPFRVVEFENRQFIRLVKHEGYWGGTPHIDELIYQYFENDEAMVQALSAGTVDFLDSVPPTLVGTLEGQPGITVNRAPSTDFAELGFNSWDPTPERFEAEGCGDCPRGPTTGSMGDPWLTRPEVRAALAGLIDKQHLVEFALGGFGTPGVSIVGPLTSFYHYTPPADSPVNFPAYSDEAGREAARAQAEQRFRDAMAAIGFTDTDGNGVLNVPADATDFDPQGAGQDWSLRLFVRQDDEEDKLAGDLIGQWMTRAGAQVDVQQVSEDPQLYDATYPSSSNADYDMYVWGWGPDPDPDFIMSIFACDQINGWQDANYCDPEYDELYRSTRTATDLDERAELVKQLQDKIYHESPYAVLWYTDTLEAYRSDRWEGFNPMPRAGGALWSTYGMGPWGSRTTVGPIGAAGPTPAPESPAPSASPAASGSPTPSGAAPSGSPEPTSSLAPGPSPTAVAPTTEPTGGTPTTGPTTAPTPTQPGSGAGGDAMPLVLGAGAIAALAAVGFVLWRRRQLDDEE